MRFVGYFIILSMAFSPLALAETDADKRLQVLESRAIENTITWRSFFESRYDKFSLQNNAGAVRSYDIHRFLLGLDFQSQASSRLTLYGRLTASKLFNGTQGKFASDPSSYGSQGRAYGVSGIFLERAFANYQATERLSLSLGRLPTIDGPPTHIYDHLPRQGSYPRLAYSTILDGYALNFNLLQSELQKLSIRYIYSPIMELGNPNRGKGGEVFSEVTRPDPYTRETSTAKQMTDFHAFMVDYSSSSFDFARDLAVILQHNAYLKTRPFDSIVADLHQSNIYLEAADIGRSTLTLYGNYSESKESTQINARNPDGSTSELIYHNTGSSFLLGQSLQIPVDAMGKPRFGVEGIQSSRNFSFYDYTPREPFYYFNIRGKGWHSYLTWPLDDDSLKVRIGYLYGKPSHVSVFSGLPGVPSEEVYRSLYINIRIDN